MNVRFPPRYARGFAMRDEHALGLLSMFPPRYARGFALRDEHALDLLSMFPPRYARGFALRDEHAESGQCDCQTMGGLVYSSTRNQCAPVICAGWNHGRADFN